MGVACSYCGIIHKFNYNVSKGISFIEKISDDTGANTAMQGVMGGYYARIFLNVKGREPNGVNPQEEYESAREELRRKLMQIKGPNGETFLNKVYTPEELYVEPKGDKPDLMVYFDNLYWRSAGTIGHKSLYLDENDTGPDDSVHWYDGIFILYNKKKVNHVANIDRMSIYDVAPTILDIMGIDVPSDMLGKALTQVKQ